MGQLAREDTVKSSVARSRYDRSQKWTYSGDSFTSKYDYYDGNKHLNDYLYDSTKDVLGSFKHARSRYDRSQKRTYSGDSFTSKYDYYDGNKHLNDYLYDSTKDVLGSFKHYNLSKETLRIRNMRS